MRKLTQSMPIMLSVQLMISLLLNIIFTVNALADNSIPLNVKQQLLTGQFSEAASELRLLSAQGNSAAKYQLAILFLDGKGVQQSFIQAEKLLIESAEHNPEATFLLGSLYLKGNKLSKDLAAANKYLELAAASGNSHAKQLLKVFDREQSDSPNIKAQTQRHFEFALLSGDLSQVIHYYNQGANLEYQGGLELPPLMMSIKLKRLNVSQWLIRQNLNLQQRDAVGNSAMHYAAQLDLIEILIALNNKLKMLDPVNANGQTPLMIAVNNRNKIAAQWLLSKGADFSIVDQTNQSAKDYNQEAKLDLIFATKLASNNTKSQHIGERQRQSQLAALQNQSTSIHSIYYGWPPIVIAAAQNQTDLIENLLAQGDDPWLANSAGENAVYFALLHKQHIAKNILQRHPINKTRNLQVLEKLLLLAIKENLTDMTTQLVEIIPASDTQKLIAHELEVTIKINDLSATLSLLEFSADIPLEKLLFQAINRESVELVRLLIAKGASLVWKDEYGRSALLLASRKGNVDLLKMLVSLNTDIDQTDNQGLTALMWSTKRGCVSCATFLMTHQANPEKQSNNGNNAIMFAAQLSNEILQLFLAQERTLSLRNKQSFTALMLAVKSQSIDSARSLLEVDANPRRKNARGQDSFDLANQIPEMLSLLKQY